MINIERWLYNTNATHALDAPCTLYRAYSHPIRHTHRSAFGRRAAFWSDDCFIGQPSQRDPKNSYSSSVGCGC